MTGRSKKTGFIIGLLLIVILVAVAVLYNYEPDTGKTKKISLIVYGNDADRWENLRDGAELAAMEDNAEVSLVTMSDEEDAKEQLEIIKREISNGADALMIAACDSEEIGKYIDKAKIRIPVIFVETGIESDSEQIVVSANDYQMGYALGNRIHLDENYIVKVAVISDGTNRNSIKERQQGLMDALGNNVREVVVWERNWNERGSGQRMFIQRELVSEAVDVIVTLDNSMTDALMDALSNLNKEAKVYSISTSDEAVYCLDSGRIKVLTYQTEFGIGYIGAKYAIDEKSAAKTYGNEDIQYRVVDKDNMYDYDNQTLLFPFVK